MYFNKWNPAAFACIIATLFSFKLYSQCPTYATNIGHSTGNVLNVNSSLGAPDGTGSTFSGNEVYSRIVWNMGTVMPAGTQICFKIKKTGTEANAAFKIWYGLDGNLDVNGNPPSGYIEVYSTTTFTNTSYTDVCITLPVGNCRYVKITSENVTDFNVDAVTKNCPVSCPSAGNDGATTVCESSNFSINLFDLISNESATTGTWTRLPGGTGGNFAGSTFTPAQGATSSTFRYVLLGTAPCPNDTSIATVNIIYSPIPVIVTQPSTICQNSTYTFCAENNITGIDDYHWNFGSNASPSTSKNRCVDVSWSTTGVKTIKLYYNMLNGCYTDTISVNVTVNPGVSCCTGKVTSLYFTNGTSTLPISNGSSFNVNAISGLYYFETGNTGTIGSIQYTITGPTPSSNIENTTPYNSPGTGGGNWTGAVGNYSVNLKTYSESGASGTLCHDTTITFSLINPNCDCPNNLVLNPSFENFTYIGGVNVPDHWTPTEPDNVFQSDAFAAQCGVKAAQQDGTSDVNLATFYQDVTLTTGTAVQLKFKAGTHIAANVAKFGLIFYNGNTKLDSSFTEVDHILGTGTMSEYIINRTAPAGTTKVRVMGKTGADWLKVDQICLTSSITCTPPNAGTDGSTTVCESSNIPINLFDLITGETAGGTWTRIPGSTGGTFLGSTFTPAQGATSSTFRYVVTGTSPCPNDTSIATVNILPSPIPVIISGPTTVCKNTVSIFCAENNVPGLQYYEWDFGPGATPQFTKNRCPEVTWSTTGVKTIYLYYIMLNGCYTDTVSMNVTVIDCSATLGDKVFVDANANGQQDGGEAGIPGVIVKLLNSTLVEIARDTTDANGIYGFNNLTPGVAYVVDFDTPAGYSQTLANQGADATDSDATGANGQTGTYTLANNETNNTVDAGYYQTAAIGDRIWVDANANGIQDGGETNYTGSIVVNLYYDANKDGLINGTEATTPFATQTTTTGTYNFTGLTPGNYQVGFVLPSGQTFSPADATGDAADSDANTTTGRTAITNLTSGETDNTFDAGLYQKANLGDKVFVDANANGQQDGGEIGIAGVIVKLLNSALVEITRDTTDANGIYGFNNLTPGVAYVVDFDTPAGYSQTVANQGADATDSDATGANGQTSTYTLANNETNNTVDAGYYLPVNLGNFVWFDQNNNGIQDLNEPGIANASVQLYTGAGVAVGVPVLTSATGAYNFTNLTPGDYIVGVTTPGGFTSSAINGGDPDTDADNNDDNGSVVNGGQIRSLPVTLTSGGEPGVAADGDGTNGNLTVDFGFVGVGTIGDFVWNDNNGNGIQDGGTENGVAGVIATLTYTYNGTAYTVKDTTDAAGMYLFTNLPADGITSYTVVFSNIPAGLNLTTSNAAGSNDNNDSDGLTPPSFTLPTATPNNTSIDLGLNSVVNLGNFVWFDQNNNGIQDGTEPGIAGASVQLYTGAGVAIGAPVLTLSNGQYNFTNLTPGDYIVGVTPPGGFTSSAINGGDPDADADNNDDNGSVVNGAQIRSLPVTLTSGGEPAVGADGDGTNGNLTVDFGFTGTGSIGDLVWNDKDADGVQDLINQIGGEPGIQGVIVTLNYTINGTSYTLRDTTDAIGAYLFPNLPPATYTLVFSNVPAGYNLSPSNLGGNDNNDSDGLTPPAILLSAGQNDLSIDLGLYQLAVIGNFVWNDNNANGIQDIGEPGIQGVSVTLTNVTTLVNTSATTNASGKYLFSGLTPGTYKVTFTTPAGGFIPSPKDTIATTDDKDSDASRTTGMTGNYTLIGGQTDTTVDAGFYQLSSLGDYVWFDWNRNGRQDKLKNNVNDEVPALGVKMYLYNATTNTLLDSTVTNASGLYLFSNLFPGMYYVKTTGKDSFDITQKDAGANDAKDSDFDPITYQSHTVTLPGGAQNLTIDLGLYRIPTKIIDPCICKNNATNGDNGQFDEIVDVNATPGGVWEIIAQTGMYLVTSPAPPAAPIPVPLGTTMTEISEGKYQFKFIHIDSMGYSITVSDGEDTLSISNFCIYPYLVLQSFDTALCLYDAPVTLSAFSNIPGNISYTIITSGNQQINTNVINPQVLGVGTFTLRVTFTPTNAALCQNTIIRALNINISNCPASLGNFVWNDLNADGDQDPGEPGIPNVSVTLTNVTTSATTPTTTGSNGKYLFTGLAPGTYKVTFGTPSGGFVATTANVSSNTLDGVDSDAGSGGMTGNYVLIAGQVDTSVDAGYYMPASLGDYVWFDKNGNGRQNTGEVGIQNVIVKLTNIITNEMRLDTTDASGKYLFTNLPAGTYKVLFTPPAGPNGNTYGITRSNFGTDDFDNDMLATSETGNYILAAGQIDTSVDAGFTLPDLQPTLTFAPTSFVVNASTNYTLPINVVCRVSEVGRATTNGSNIVVTIPRTIFINFNYNPSATMIGGQPVNNNQWVQTQTSTNWVFTYTGPFSAFGNSYFGFDGTFNTQTATGVYFMAAQIVNGSGGETNFGNNNDSERVDYFSN